MEVVANALTLVHSPHPISAVRDRETIQLPMSPGDTVADMLQKSGLCWPNRQYIVAVNGHIVPPDNMARHVVAESDVITLRASVHGGGGGGSDPIRTVLTIAVLSIAPQAGAFISGATGSVISPLLGQALFNIGGMLLINQLVPYQAPEPDRQPSPTYSLSGSQNRSRLFEPMPLVLGVHRIFPDHGAKPHTEFVGNDQFLYQVFNFGLSDLQLSDLKIGDTALSDFADVTQEISDSTGAITIFPENVDAISGGDLTGGALDTYVTKTSSVGTTGLAIELQGLCYFQDKRGIQPLRLTLDIEYRATGSGPWLPFTGTNPVIVEHGSREVLRLGYEINVAEGQYEVRVKLRSPAEVQRRRYASDEDADSLWEYWYESVAITDPPGPNTYVTLRWFQLKSLQPNDADYTGQQRVALKIKASGQLNGNIDAFNAIASAHIPVWNGNSWITQASSNPAWQFLWLARGKTISGRRIYGGNLPDSRIDIEQLKAWGSWCDSKGLSCNIIFDRKGQSVDEQLRIVAACGRAAPTWSKGILGVVYDEADQPIAGIYGMSNIVRNTFEIEYLTGRLADEIVANWINPALGYKPDTVRATVPGVTSPVNEATITLQGCTNESQAGREANLRAAEQAHRRRRITWQTDFEGMVQTRGDVVALSHDLTQWGYSGRLIEGTTTTLKLDREVPFDVGQDHYIRIRFPDGSYDIYDVIYQPGSSDTITLADPLPSAPNDDPNNPVLDYLWLFEPEATPGKKVKIVDIVPVSEGRVRIVATDEDNAYYANENSSYTYITPGTFGTSVPTISNASVSDTLVQVGNSYATRITVSWDVTGEYGGALIRAAALGETLKDIDRVVENRCQFDWPVAGGEIQIEVQLFNYRGQIGDQGRVNLSLTVLGKDAPPSDVTGLIALQNGGSVVIKWNPPNDVDYLETDIRYGKRGLSSFEGATPLNQKQRGNNVTTVALPPGDLTIYAKHVDADGRLSETAASVDIVVVNDYDIIEQSEQAPDWSGTLVNLVKHWTGKLYPESNTTIDALGWRLFDEFAPDPHQICSYEAPEIDVDFDDDVRVWGDIQSELGPGITEGVADPTLEIDYRLDAGGYDGFEPWTVGDVRLRYCKHKLVLDTDRGVALITGFLPTVDLKEHEISIDNIDVAIGGSAVVFPRAFHRIPQVTAVYVGGAARTAVPSNVTETGFDINVYNTSGTSVGTTTGEHARYDAKGV